MTESKFHCLQHPVYLLSIPYGSTEATTSKIVQQHKVHKTKFDTTKACDDYLKQQILSASHNDYV